MYNKMGYESDINMTSTEVFFNSGYCQVLSIHIHTQYFATGIYLKYICGATYTLHTYYTYLIYNIFLTHVPKVRFYLLSLHNDAGLDNINIIIYNNVRCIKIKNILYIYIKIYIL